MSGRILSDEQVADIRRRGARGETYESLAERFGIVPMYASHIIHGHSRTKPARQATDPRIRFRRLVREEGEHWIWTACTDKRGNGWFTICFSPKRTINANRAAWLLFRSDEGLVRNDYVKRTCGRTDCVAPWHIEKRRVGR